MDRSELEVVMSSGLFDGMSEREVEAAVSRLVSRRASFGKDEGILWAGEPVGSLGLILSGVARVIKEDFCGRWTILTELRQGDTFAEVYALLPDVPIEVSVVSAGATEVLFLDARREPWLMRGLQTVLARKALALSRRVELLSKRTIRERLLSYLSSLSLRQGSARVTVPFTRQELAEHLSVDRSALSGEIGKLCREGVFECEGKAFVMKERTDRP